MGNIQEHCPVLGQTFKVHRKILSNGADKEMWLGYIEFALDANVAVFL